MKYVVERTKLRVIELTNQKMRVREHKGCRTFCCSANSLRFFRSAVYRNRRVAFKARQYLRQASSVTRSQPFSGTLKFLEANFSSRSPPGDCSPSAIANGRLQPFLATDGVTRLLLVFYIRIMHCDAFFCKVQHRASRS